MAYEDFTVQQFQDAWFKQDSSVMDDAKFKEVYAEYVDTSGLFHSEDFERQGLIYNISAKINYVKLFIRLQRDFIHSFRIPFVRDFPNIKMKYGYVLRWDGDLEGFEKQLENIEFKEKRNQAFLDSKILELNNSRKSKGVVKDDETTLVESRQSFIRMINSLAKVGYKIDKNVTTVEELALMIKQQLEEIDESKRQRHKHHGG